MRARLDGGALDLQHGRDLSVALALLEQELEDRALIGGKLVEAGHAEREASGARPDRVPVARWIFHFAVDQGFDALTAS